tara:strand:+ start:723 stop:959 length:237 start_codon:yes stop_codon:yes gene_type:complete
MSNLVVFNDSFGSDGFVDGVKFINKQLEKHKLRVKIQFIEDFESDEGEYAWYVTVVPDDLPMSHREEKDLIWGSSDYG